MFATVRPDQWDKLLKMRGILAFYVVLHHARNLHFPRLSELGPETPQLAKLFFASVNILGEWGLQAVLGFFVISGLSISAGYKPNYSRSGFYLRRFKRLYPALCFSVLLSGLLALASNYEMSLRNLIATLSFQNGITFGGSFAKNSPYWSLSCEAWYYLVFPLLIPFLKSKTHTLALIAFILVTSPFLVGQRFYAVYAYSSVWFLGVYFVQSGFRLPTRFRGFLRLSAVFLLLVPFIVLDFLDLLSSQLGHVAKLVSGIAIGYLIIDCLHSRRFEGGRKILTFLGNISYSLYLVHYPILLLVQRFVETENRVHECILVSAFSITISLFVASCCFRFVERPFLARRKRVPREPGPEPAQGRILAGG